MAVREGALLILNCPKPASGRAKDTFPTELQEKVFFLKIEYTADQIRAIHGSLARE
jgi:hypothetical protein